MDRDRSRADARHDAAENRQARAAHLYRRDGKFISFYGDNHPVYAGNVVKAMASAKDGYPSVVKLHEDDPRGRSGAPGGARRVAARAVCAPRRSARRDRRRGEAAHADDHRGRRARADGREALRAGPVLSSAELRERRAARRGTVLATEGFALTGAWVDKERRADLADHARDGHVVAPLRAMETGRADRRHGRDRVRRPRSRKARRCCSRAAASATPCCSRSARRCEPRAIV